MNNTALDNLNNIIDNNFEHTDCIKRKYGIVEQLIYPPSYGSEYPKVKVNICAGSEEENTKSIILLNKTGEVLSVGDAVWVYYWNTITDGYVAIKIGLSTQSDYPLPQQFNLFTIENKERVAIRTKNIHTIHISPEFVPYSW